MRASTAAMILIATLVQGNANPGRADFKIAESGISDAVVTPDGKTLIYSVPSKGELVFVDTLTETEVKRVEVEFKPDLLACQQDWLYVTKMGAPAIYEIRLPAGKTIKQIKLGGEPLQGLACHPSKGLLYVTNTNQEVFSIDPVKGEATRTKADGQMIVVDPRDGNHVYTGIQKPIRDVLLVEGGGRGNVKVSRATLGSRALILKFVVRGKGLNSMEFNDNAAINGRGGVAVSFDGKLVAMAGGGGWKSKTEPRTNYCLAVFETAEMTDLAGQVDVGPYPSAVAFHPNLPLGAVYRDSAKEIIVFSAKSFVKKATFKNTVEGSPPRPSSSGGKAPN